MVKMLRFFVAVLAGLMVSLTGYSQARVQLIHNSPDTANRYVDVWIGSSKVFNNLEFRTSTSFVDVPAGNQISIVLTDSSSTNPANPLAIYRRTFESGHKYILVINGMVDPTGYNPYFELGITAFDLAREQASNPSKTDLLFLQGVTDLPEVDVVEANLGLISNNQNYLDFDGYFGFNPADLILFVKDNASQSTLYSYELPLVSLGLQGQAGVVVMSGFVDPATNSLGKPFGMFLALPNGGDFIQLPVYSEPTAPLQFVHNSPNPEADSLDIWIDGRLAVNNMKFRTATAFNTQPAGRNITIAVCSPNSLNPNDPIVSVEVVLTENVPYQVVLNGMTSPAGYNPPTPAALHIFSPARVGAQVTGNTDLLFTNGSTDFGVMKVNEIASSLGTLASNLSFGAFEGYQEVLNANYAFEVRNSYDESVAVYEAALANQGMVNQSSTVLASGFINKPANNNGPAFGLFLVPQNGGGLFSLPPYTPPTFAEFQFVHNSADKAFDSVDVWVNSEKKIAGLAFRSASALMQVQAGNQVVVAVKPFGSTSPDSPLASQTFTPESGKKYGFFIQGIKSSTGYSPAPPFELLKIDNMKVNSTSGGVCDVMVLHQSTDAPSPADFIELNSVWLLGMTYGQHSNYMQKTVFDYSIGFRHPDSANPYKYYFLPVDELGLAGKAFYVVTSGFFNTTANSNGEPFGLWAVVPTGGKMVELSDVTGVDDVNNSLDIAVYPNPARQVIHVVSNSNARIASVEFVNLAGQLVKKQPVGFVSSSTHVDVSDLQRGMYLMKIYTQNSAVVRMIEIVR